MKSAKKGVSVEEWRARWWTGEDARVRAVQGAARRCTAGVGRWSRRRVSALSGAADANPSEQQAALRLLDAAHTDRDIGFYHWPSQSFGDFWKDAISVLMARERCGAVSRP